MRVTLCWQQIYVSSPSLFPSLQTKNLVFFLDISSWIFSLGQTNLSFFFFSMTCLQPPFTISVDIVLYVCQNYKCVLSLTQTRGITNQFYTLSKIPHIWGGRSGLKGQLQLSCVPVPSSYSWVAGGYSCHNKVSEKEDGIPVYLLRLCSRFIPLLPLLPPVLVLTHTSP